MFSHTVPILNMLGLENNTGSDDYCTVIFSLQKEMDLLSKQYTKIEDFDFQSLVVLFNEHRRDIMTRITDDIGSYAENPISFVQSIPNKFSPSDDEVKALFDPNKEATNEVKVMVCFYVITCMFD